jgi:hypothetical protein
MRRHRHTIVRTAFLSAVVSAALTGPAVAQDLRSPDARDLASPSAVALDLRSPDARDIATPIATDLRSPDASVPVVVPAARPAVKPAVTRVDDGFDLVSAVLGAGSILVLLLAGASAMWVVGRRRSTASRRGVAPARG